MNPLFIDFVLAPISLAAGVCLGIYVRAVPMRGWVAMCLLFFSAAIWTFSEPKDTSMDERTWLLPCFTFVAPVAVIYSFRARKLAPDRMLARPAFIASLIIAALLVFMVCGMIMAFSLLFSSPHFTLAPLAPTATFP